MIDLERLRLVQEGDLLTVRLKREGIVHTAQLVLMMFCEYQVHFEGDQYDALNDIARLGLVDTADNPTWVLKAYMSWRPGFCEHILCPFLESLEVQSGEAPT